MRYMTRAEITCSFLRVAHQHGEIFRHAGRACLPLFSFISSNVLRRAKGCTKSMNKRTRNGHESLAILVATTKSMPFIDLLQIFHLFNLGHNVVRSSVYSASHMLQKCEMTGPDAIAPAPILLHCAVK